MKVLFAISISLYLLMFASSVNAAPQIMQRATKALKTAAVGIAFAAMVVSGDAWAENTAKVDTTIEHDATYQEHTDALASHEDHDDATRKEFIWFGNYFGIKPDIPKSDIWLTVTDMNGEGQARLGFATQLLGDEAGNAFMFLRGEGSVDNQEDSPYRLPFMQGHVFRFANSHAGDKLPLIVSLFGYEYLDFRADDFDGDTEGFTTHHAHLVGVETPVLSSSIGIAGNFSQADLDYWAGEGADIYYFLFHNGSLGFLWSPHERLEFSVDAKQLRTLGSHIEFSDYTEGDFTAIWEEVALKAALDIYIDQLQLIGNVRFYRQRINANDEFGNSFSSRQNGNKAAVKLQMSFD